MNLQKILATMALAILILITGCEKPAETASGDGGSLHDLAHSHEPGDELVWESKEKLDDGYEIWLGHHGDHFHAGNTIEPSVAIMKDGKAFADAAVFNQLVDPDDSTKTITDEVATVYEPKTEEEIAHYAQGGLKIPDGDVTRCVVRFRIQIDAESLSRDMEVKVGH